ncbi:unnamed protein product, partial [marine sediment metagenome]
RAYISTWVMRDFSGGVGLKRIDVDNDDHFKRLWDSTAETRWLGQVTPSLEAQEAGKTGGAEIVSRIVAFKGDYFCLGLDGTDLNCLKWTSPNWASAGDVVTLHADSGTYGKPCDLIVSQDGGVSCLLASYKDVTTGPYYGTHFKKSTDGANWSSPTDSYIHTASASTAPFPSEKALLVIGSELFVCTFTAENLIKIYKKTDVDAEESEVCSFQSGGEGTGFIAFWDTSGNFVPFVGTQEGWWMIDTTNNKAVFYGDLTESISIA